MFVEELKEFGLSEKEAKVYLALLELEVATVQEIAKAAEVNRSSAYVVLESLKKRGLVSVSGGKKVQKYVVAPPDRLVRMAEQRAKKHADIKSRIGNILPDLKSLYKGTKQKPRVQVFEGVENIITHLEETLEMREKVMRVYSSGSRMHDFFEGYMPIYMRKRAQKSIKMYGIHPDNPENQALSKYQPETDESVYIPAAKYRFTSDFAIYDNTISYVSQSGEYAITIESKDIADAMRSAFDLAFEGAKQLKSSKKKSARRR